MNLKVRVLAAVSVFMAGLALVPQQAKAVDADLSEFNHVDPRQRISDVPLMRALAYFKKNQALFSNKRYLGIVDYTKHSSKKRFFIVDLQTGAVDSMLTAHGRGSDPDGDGWAKRFSNRSGTKASSTGFFRTGEIYSGDHGRSMRLDGLSSTNSNALVRAVVIHGADYVNEEDGWAGRSHGCPAVDWSKRNLVLEKLKGGALVYGYAGANPTQF